MLRSGPAELGHLLAAAALSPESTLRRLAQWMVEHQEEASRLSISALAAATGVSETTVFRFCRALGFSGYRDLRLHLAESRGAARGSQLLPLDWELNGEEGETFAHVARRIVEVHTEALHDTLRLIDPAMLERATAQLLEARTIHLMGFGSSAPVAGDAWQRFLRLGLLASVHSDPHVLAALAANAPPGSLFFAVSYSGQTRDIVETLETVGQRGCVRIALTANARGAIAGLAETVLLSAARRSPVTQDSIATRVSQLAVIDMLCVGIALRHSRRSEFLHEGVLFEREIAKKRVPPPAAERIPAKRKR